VRLLVVALLIAAVAFVGFRLTEKRADERRLAGIARDIAHRDVTIRCQGRVGELVDVDGEYGSVRFGADGRPDTQARLDRPICTSLARLARGDSVPLERASLAVEALAHEAYHLAGVQDEAATQCYGLQAMRFVAARLGVSDDLAGAYVRAATARYPTLPEAYRSAECREGGALDLHPETGVFP
jgi:hypothetical protein